MQIYSQPYIYWVCWLFEYLTKLWGFVGWRGIAGLRGVVVFTPTLQLATSRAHPSESPVLTGRQAIVH